MPVRVLPAPDKRAMPKSVIFKHIGAGVVHEIRGLDIAMDDLLLVRESQRFGRAADQFQHFARLQ